MISTKPTSTNLLIANTVESFCGALESKGISANVRMAKLVCVCVCVFVYYSCCIVCGYPAHKKCMDAYLAKQPNDCHGKKRRRTKSRIKSKEGELSPFCVEIDLDILGSRSDLSSSPHMAGQLSPPHSGDQTPSPGSPSFTDTADLKPMQALKSDEKEEKQVISEAVHGLEVPKAEAPPPSSEEKPPPKQLPQINEPKKVKPLPKPAITKPAPSRSAAAKRGPAQKTLSPRGKGKPVSEHEREEEPNQPFGKFTMKKHELTRIMQEFEEKERKLKYGFCVSVLT